MFCAHPIKMEKVEGGKINKFRPAYVSSSNRPVLVAGAMFAATGRKCRLIATDGENCDFKYSRKEGIDILAGIYEKNMIEMFLGELLDRGSKIFTGHLTPRDIEVFMYAMRVQDVDQPDKPFDVLENAINELTTLCVFDASKI